MPSKRRTDEIAMDDAGLGFDGVGLDTGGDSVGLGTIVLVRHDTVDVVTVTSAKVLVTLHYISPDDPRLEAMLHVHWIDYLGCCQVPLAGEDGTDRD